MLPWWVDGGVEFEKLPLVSVVVVVEKFEDLMPFSGAREPCRPHNDAMQLVAGPFGLLF